MLTKQGSSLLAYVSLLAIASLLMACEKKCPNGTALLNGGCVKVLQTEQGVAVASPAGSGAQTSEGVAGMAAPTTTGSPSAGGSSAVVMGTRSSGGVQNGSASSTPQGNSAPSANDPAMTNAASDAGAASSPADNSASANDEPVAVCNDGELRCSTAMLGTLETCVGGQWAQQPCAAEEMCLDASDGARCVLPVEACAGRDGQNVCTDAGEMLACLPGGEAMTVATCADAALCKAGIATGACAQCEPGAMKCSGAELEVCSPDGQGFATQEPCASAALCNAQAGRCNAPACEADEHVCEGDTLKRCVADQTALMVARLCGRGLCDAANKDCKVCNPGAKSCAGNTLMTCDSEGRRLERGAACSGETPTCDAEQGCVECAATTDCRAVHDCAELSGCTGGKCQFRPKPRQTGSGNGRFVRAGKPETDPIYLVLGNALFYVREESEVDFNQVNIESLSRYLECPVAGTLIRDRGDALGYIYVSDGSSLNWVKSPDDLQQYCGGEASVLSAPTGSLSSPAFPPPLGTCRLNRN
jgi:hypothetical protein